jgi:GTP-binding protein HflX
LKTAQRRRLEKIVRRKVSPELIITPELARTLCDLSSETGRQIGVLIDRSGQVLTVIVGDARQIVIPALADIRSAGGRLKGIRCVHTHLAGENLTEDDLMDLLFLRLDLMAIVKMQANGLPERIYAAHLIPTPEEGKDWHFLPPMHPTRQEVSCSELITAIEGEFSRVRPLKKVEQNRDRAILISVSAASRTKERDAARESMDELLELARTADVLVLDRVVQRRKRINPKYLLGKGKLAEIMLAALRFNANLLIFDMELNPSQIRSITDHTDLRVIDRTQLILDIRGPGETRLEVDRRRINDRLTRLAKELKAVSRERYQRRGRRRKKNVPVISLVGYTNAGKSTLLNTLTNSRIIAEDKLFATLDPTSRRLRFPRDTEVIITDTVGFIRNLPKELLQAFKATLEELHEADLLVHVIDIGNPRFADQIEVVETLLHELQLDAIPCLRLFNKIDLVDSVTRDARMREYDGIPISALDSGTFLHFLEKAEKIISSTLVH